jgi:glycosyltransferase involved in cell wall biosynthesis
MTQAAPVPAANSLGPGTISACLIVRNEEPVIRRCLAGLEAVVDEVVVVHDGRCGDRTLEIARDFGARTYERPLTGNPEAHTVFAYQQARGDWLLNIDADEFLSQELRSALRNLTTRSGVNGYEFLWRMWDGTRYFTEGGPHKLALFRRSATHLVGLLQNSERIDGVVERLPLQLEHRPLYNNFTRRSMATKWRRWARIQARQLLSAYGEVPRFNVPATPRWPLRRRVLNLLSPVLVLPYGLAMFIIAFSPFGGWASFGENFRLALFSGVYGAMVEFYVAKFLILGVPPEAEVAAEPSSVRSRR